MYRSYYNLVKKPFQLTTDPRFLWLGEKHKEALATLKYGVIDQKGFLLVTGDVGTGKTTLINALLESIEEDTLVASITDPAFDLIEFFNFVALSFDIPQKFDSKIDFIVYFSKFLKRVYSENKSVLLIVDEVHRIPKEVLEHIRLLSNIELPEEKLINIFFVGQNEIHQTLALPECRALRQRISLIYQIKPLSKNETLEYIRHRLKVAGTEKNIFTQDAVREIYLFSKGYPRLINIICDHALLTGYAWNLKNITPDVIQECALQFRSIGEDRNNTPSISHDQHDPECRSHSVTCPFLNDIAETTSSSKDTKNRMVILPQSESSRKQENAEKQTQHIAVDDSKPYTAGLFQICTFYWPKVVYFVTRIQKKLVSLASAASPIIKRIRKNLFLRVSSAALIAKHMQKRLFSWISDSAASLPAFLRNKRFFWISAASLSLIILIVGGLYQKALTTKINPSPPLPRVVKTDASFPDKSEGHSISADDPIQVSETTQDHLIKDSSPKKTERPKSNEFESAITAMQNKNYNRAIELFEQIITQNPKNTSMIKMHYLKALQSQADSIFVINPGKARILLSKAIEIDPQNAEAHFKLGRLYTKSKEYPKAIKAYQKAASLNHRPSDAFYNLGFIYASTEDFVNAEKMFLHVIELKPDYMDKVLFNLAVVQQKQGKKQQCIDNLEKAVTNNPKNQRAQQYLNQLKKSEGMS